MQSLSVVFTCYNQEEIFPELLEMQFSQTRQADEIIIVDDASTDNSYEVIKKLVADKKQVKLYRNEKNLGLLGNINKALSLATKTFLHIPSDNIIAPEFYEKSFEALSKYPHASLCVSNPSTYTGGHTQHYSFNITKEFIDKDDIVALTKRRQYIPNAAYTILVRRELLKEFNPLLKWHTDYFILSALALRHGACFVSGNLAAFRKVPTSYSRLKGPQLQRRSIYHEMFRLLKTPEFQDVRPYFKKARLLDHFGLPVLAAILTRFQNLDFLSLNLINHALRSTLIKPLETKIKKLLSKSS